MIWWQWIVLGAFVLAAEMFVDAEFYLVFLGISAILVGGTVLAVEGLPMWSHWLLFAGAAVSSLLIFRGPVYRKIRGAAPALTIGIKGQVVVVDEALPAGGRARVQLRGAEWDAVNVGDEEIAANGRARVERASGLTLEVRAES